LKGKISYYKILGVDENASNLELRKAFCKLSIELHPDTTSLEIDVAKSKFQDVLEAYENLNNSNLRRIYDYKLKEKSKSKNNNEVLNNLIIDSNNQNLIGNRRPFSNGELFSLFLLIIIISISLICSIFIASFTGKELEKLPEYYIMKLEDTMVESVTKFFPQKTNCDWLNDDELDVYTNTFFQNGFQSALNWYRCMTSENQNKELNVFQGKLINNFTLYISGEKDWGMYQKPGALNEMTNLCKNFKGIKIIKNAGHWVQQEKPEDVAKAILNFYSSFA